MLQPDLPPPGGPASENTQRREFAQLIHREESTASHNSPRRSPAAFHGRDSLRIVNVVRATGKYSRCGPLRSPRAEHDAARARAEVLSQQKLPDPSHGTRKCP